MMTDTEPGAKIALVTGGSRGVGAATARYLAERGYDVVVNYRNKAKRAEAVVAEVNGAGQRGWIVQADLTDAEQVAAMMQQVERDAGPLDLLVLNASGGLERGMAEDYAMQVNLHAQLRRLDLALPLLREGGRVVFVTSHLAHFHGEKPVYPAYEPVAARRRARRRCVIAFRSSPKRPSRWWW